MGRIIYKVLIEENEIAIFYELDDAMVFIKGLCEKYYNQLKEGVDFTIKEEIEGEESKLSSRSRFIQLHVPNVQMLCEQRKSRGILPREQR